ncbi:MAG: hypothetical protein AAF958_10485 [Planctomycetota bacterium]
MKLPSARVLAGLLDEMRWNLRVGDAAGSQRINDDIDRSPSGGIDLDLDRLAQAGSQDGSSQRVLPTLIRAATQTGSTAVLSSLAEAIRLLDEHHHRRRMAIVMALVQWGIAGLVMVFVVPRIAFIWKEIAFNNDYIRDPNTTAAGTWVLSGTMVALFTTALVLGLLMIAWWVRHDRRRRRDLSELETPDAWTLRLLADLGEDGVEWFDILPLAAGLYTDDRRAQINELAAAWNSDALESDRKNSKRWQNALRPKDSDVDHARADDSPLGALATGPPRLPEILLRGLAAIHADSDAKRAWCLRWRLAAEQMQTEDLDRRTSQVIWMSRGLTWLLLGSLVVTVALGYLVPLIQVITIRT